MLIGIDASALTHPAGFGRVSRCLIDAILSKPRPFKTVVFIRNAEQRQLISGSAWKIINLGLDAESSSTRSLVDVFKSSLAIEKSGVNLMYFPTPLACVPLSRRIKVVATIYDLICIKYPSVIAGGVLPHLANRLKEWYTLKKSSLMITASEHSAQEISAYWNVPRERIMVLPLAANHLLDLPPAENLETNGERFILYVGALLPHKNLLRLIEAFAKIAGNSQVNLLLVGSYGKGLTYHQQLQDLISELKLEDRIKFSYQVSDQVLKQLYQQAEFVVQPSLDEGFGLPLLEAQVCGARIVASNSGSLPEVLGDSAIYFEAQSTPQITSALEQALNQDRNSWPSTKSPLLTRSWSMVADELCERINCLIKSSS